MARVFNCPLKKPHVSYIRKIVHPLIGSERHIPLRSMLASSQLNISGILPVEVCIRTCGLRRNDEVSS